MATRIICDVCGATIDLLKNVNPLNVNRQPYDLCDKCAKELRLWMISRFRGAETETEADDDDP